MVATLLSQAVLAGMDPSVYRNIQDIQNGEDYLKTGMDASPTTVSGVFSLPGISGWFFIPWAAWVPKESGAAKKLNSQCRRAAA